MKFITIFAVIASPALALAASTSTTTLGYDKNYGTGSSSLSTVACSDGGNGLETAGYTDFASIPNFPYIASTSAIAGWNSASCGSCWKLTYTPDKGDARSIRVTAVDHADSGFYTSLHAMNDLTNGQAKALGVVTVTAKQIADKHCGL